MSDFELRAEVTANTRGYAFDAFLSHLEEQLYEAFEENVEGDAVVVFATVLAVPEEDRQEVLDAFTFLNDMYKEKYDLED